jgi:hypothetical protein
VGSRQIRRAYVRGDRMSPELSALAVVIPLIVAILSEYARGLS